MVRNCLFVFLLFLFIDGYAQELGTTYSSDSSVIITKDKRLDELLDKQKKQNLEKQTMPGYRVQIYFGVNRPKASDVKSDFSAKYPDIASYLSYQQPNFKVRVGDFPTRLEAQKFLKQIEGKYPTTFVVPDEVKLPPLH